MLPTAMSGDLTRAAIAAQPDWLRAVPTGLRFPDGVRRLFTGCGTSFHAAQTGGDAVQALELVLRPERDAELLVIVSHEGETPLTLEAAEAWRGPRWLVTGKAESPLAALCDEVVVCTPAVEESWCHTASYTCAVAAIDALARQRDRLARRRGRSARRASRPRRTSASSSPAPGGTGRRRRRRC